MHQERESENGSVKRRIVINQETQTLKIVARRTDVVSSEWC